MRQNKSYFFAAKKRFSLNLLGCGAILRLAMSSFDAIESKMEAVGLSRAAIDAFRHCVEVLESKQSMMIPAQSQHIFISLKLNSAVSAICFI